MLCFVLRPPLGPCDFVLCTSRYDPRLLVRCSSFSICTASVCVCVPVLLLCCVLLQLLLPRVYQHVPEAAAARIGVAAVVVAAVAIAIAIVLSKLHAQLRVEAVPVG